MEEIEERKYWKTMPEISDEDEQNQFVKTGLNSLDKTIQGLILGATSIWTGTNGSNKSGTIGQIALNIINNTPYKVAMFSGELPDKRFKRWLYLQASGEYNIQKKNELGDPIPFYETPQEVKDRITRWIGNKLFLYDNQQGFDVKDIGNAIYRLLKADKSVKVVFIDNLFVIGLNDLATDKYEAQKQLLLRMTRIAQEMHVHIGFVAHPRKVVSLLRKEDISGTSDITNCADNVFILHRNTSDFKNRSKEYFGWQGNNPIYLYDNIIEIAKDRENGAVEKFIGFYFDPTCKRILNTKEEKVHYGWEKWKPQQEMNFKGEGK